MEFEFSKQPQDISSKSWVRSSLSHMVNVDQFMRKFSSTPFDNNYSQEENDIFQKWYLKKFEDIDKKNTSKLKTLLSKYRWFKISEFGEQADKDAWLLVQHADLDLKFQKQILIILTELYPISETNKSNYAYLYDRVKSIGEGKPQRYGTQGRCVGPGKWEPHEIENPSEVDKRRFEMGMVSMKEYKSWFIIICKKKD